MTWRRVRSVLASLGLCVAVGIGWASPSSAADPAPSDTPTATISASPSSSPAAVSDTATVTTATVQLDPTQFLVLCMFLGTLMILALVAFVRAEVVPILR